MPRALTLILSLLLAEGCAARAPARSAPDPGEVMTVGLAHGSKPEAATRDQLVGLVRRHALGAWLLTKQVLIDEQSIPHSHPTLTLHTRHLGSDLLLLSTFLHEQLHWFFDAHPEARARALAELAGRYPQLPVGFPDGARSRESSLEHLLVITFELRAVRRLLGEDQARVALAFWSRDHYRALYAIVGRDEPALYQLAVARGLVPWGL